LEKLADTIAIVFVLHFCWSYYSTCYRKGYSMDFWHFSLLSNLFVIHIMLPFGRSDLNVFALGSSLRRAQGHISEAYFISAFGYASILLGGTLWKMHLGIGLRKLVSNLVEIPTRGSILLLRSRSLLLVHGVLAIAILVAVLAYYFKVAGFNTDLRGLLLVVPALRPVAQFAAFYSTFIASYCFARYYTYREISMLSVVVLIMSGLLFFGERSNLVSVVMLTVTVLFIKLGRRLKLIWLAGGIAFAAFLTVLLDALREPNFSLASVVESSALLIFYGNSFSDTRDFALILSFWNGHHFWGMTYLAGVISFVPRFLSSFRDTWSLGVVTATMAGFSPTEHPGLRVGVFGEAYLNFGLPAVFLLGLAIGAVIRLVDLRMKQAADTLPPSDMRIFAYPIAMLAIGVFENSTGASTFYSIMLVLLVTWFMRRLFLFMKWPVA
jgi:oligosaccharide repeat unit polymerase